MYLLQEVCQLYNLILMPIDNIYKKIAVNKFKNQFNIKGSICSEYFKSMSKNKATGVVYTPVEIAEYIIKNTIDKDLIIKNPWSRVLDPSCGAGNFLLPLFSYLKNILEENNLFNIENIAAHIVQEMIHGCDIDEHALKILTIDMFQISGEIIEKNLFKKDFLFSEVSEQYDFIIGNPPYVGHKTINRDYSKVLKQSFKDIYKDKGDISYCFFQQAINFLKSGGRLSFITSRYFLESPSGEGLRGFLGENITISKIVDFYGIRPFKNIGIDPLIIFIEKDINNNSGTQVIKPKFNKGKAKKDFYDSVFLNKGKEYKNFLIAKKSLEATAWSLISTEENNIIEKIKNKTSYYLSDICKSYQGIITGCDKAFIINEEIINEYNIETQLIKPWIKSSYISKDGASLRDSFIIYSNMIIKESDCPSAIKFINNYRDKLLKRRECEKGYRKWYELQWGREQSIFEEEKIVFPYKSSNNRFVVDKGSYYSADVYSLIIKDKKLIDYKELSYILNSKLYEFYFKSFGKKLGEDLYEYYPSYVMKLKIPVGINIESEGQLYDFFGITDEEKEIIKGQGV